MKSALKNIVGLFSKPSTKIPFPTQAIKAFLDAINRGSKLEIEDMYRQFPGIANYTLPNRDSYLPLSLALRKKHWDIAESLIEGGRASMLAKKIHLTSTNALYMPPVIKTELDSVLFAANTCQNSNRTLSEKLIERALKESTVLMLWNGLQKATKSGNEDDIFGFISKHRDALIQLKEHLVNDITLTQHEIDLNVCFTHQCQYMISAIPLVEAGNLNDRIAALQKQNSHLSSADNAALDLLLLDQDCTQVATP